MQTYANKFRSSLIYQKPSTAKSKKQKEMRSGRQKYKKNIQKAKKDSKNRPKTAKINSFLTNTENALSCDPMCLFKLCLSLYKVYFVLSKFVVMVFALAPISVDIQTAKLHFLLLAVVVCMCQRPVNFCFLSTCRSNILQIL